MKSTSSQPLSSQPYKGTRDYYPKEKNLQNYVFETWKRVVERHGYEEYGAPILEPLELYAAKSGEELVNEQTYVFTDRGGRQVSIRPEMTPSISRMVAAKRQELAYPARLFSIANFMRYERPQRGREREFWQLNVDIFGVDSTQADIEMVSIADKILKEFGAKSSDYVIKLNSRVFINHMMKDYLGLDDENALKMTKVFDRRNKLTEDKFKNQALEVLRSAGNDAEVDFDKVIKIVNSNSVEDLPEELRSVESLKELGEVMTILENLGVESAEFDATLMRGLDYYTGIVFEVVDTHPDNRRSLFGGGRYDGLVGLFGAEPISAVGFAPGGTMMENFLEVHGLLPEYESKTNVYIALIGESSDVVSGAMKLADNLRGLGVNVELDVAGRKLDKQIKTATKKGIEFVIFVGQDDLDSGVYSIKNINTGESWELELEALKEFF